MADENQAGLKNGGMQMKINLDINSKKVSYAFIA
jgi:hypothetical protein